MTGSRTAGLVALLAAGALLAIAPRAEGRIGIEASLDRERIVELQAPATLTVVVRSSGLALPELSTPRVEGLSIEPVGSAQSFTIIQGRIERSATHSFRVRGLRSGSFTIPAIAIEAAGERAASSPLAITVLPAGAPPPGPGGNGAPEAWGGRGGPPEIFARVVADRKRAYWNEAITVHLRLYARVTLQGQPDWKTPEARGFWVEELGTPHVERVRVEGVPYVVSDIAWVFFPTRTGRLTIGPSRIRCRVERVRQAPDPWSSLGVPEVEAEIVTLETSPVDIEVEPLPRGAPEGFAGAVGSYSMAVRVDRLQIRAGEPITVTTILRGSGNVASLRDPEVAGPAGARRYVAAASTRIDRAGPELRGERSQQVSFLPGDVGTLALPPVRFAWFDPAEERYRSAGSDTIRVRVLPALGGTRPAPQSEARFEPPPAPSRRGRGPGGPLAPDPPGGALGVGSLALIGYAGALLVARARDRRAGDPRAIRRARLETLERATLRDARARLAAGQSAAAAMLAATALRAAVACRHDLPEPDGTGRALLEAARARGASREETEPIERLLDRLEAAAYGPSAAEPGGAEPAASIAAVEAIVRRYREESR